MSTVATCFKSCMPGAKRDRASVKGREGKGREGKGREGKGGEGKGEGKGDERQGEGKKGKSHQLSLMYFQGPNAVFFRTASARYTAVKKMLMSDKTLV